MSTNARIGLQFADGSVMSVYHHWDGCPEWLGVTLKEQYNTREKIAKLLDGGNMSSCYSDNVFDFDKQEFVKRDPQPEYYGGDNEAPHYGTFQQFLSDTKAGEEFLYCYPVKGGQKCSYTGGTIGWKAYSVTPIYDSNDNFINNDIQPVEIPDFDVADDS